MLNETCVFCKIIQGKIQSKIARDNGFVTAIYDICPKAPTHILLIPKKHIINLTDLHEDDTPYAWHLLKMARDISKDLCGGKGFNLVLNNGADAGQSVFHLHFHFLSGKNIFDGECKL